VSERVPITGERAISPVATPRRSGWLDTRKAIMIAVPSVALIALLVFWHNPTPRTREEMEAKEPTNHLHAAPVYQGAKPEPEPVQKIIYQPLPPAASENGLIVQTPSVTETVKQAQKPPDRVSMYAFTVPEIPEALRPKPANTGGAAEAHQDGTHAVFKGSVVPGTKAGLLEDASLVLMPGLIRCAQASAINTDLAGPFECQLPGDVKSHDGTPLMDKGTMIHGNYDSKISQGQKRILALSATAYVYPRNSSKVCLVPLGGPMADSLGRAGLPGEVDNHYLERFGFAFLLTGLDMTSNILQASLSKGGNTYLSFNSGSGVNSLAQEVLRQSINIPPTITTHQGEDVMIWITQMIDFNDCYKLVTRN